MPIRNQVKEAAASGRRIRGVHLTFAAPTIIEVLASPAGLQFVYLDGEHGNFEMREIEAACVAAERHDLTAIARIPDISTSTITRFLDRGVRGIVAPHVDSLAAAKAVVEAAYFPPQGNRSYGSGRPEYGKWTSTMLDYMADCNASVSVCIMIESRSALAEAGKIAALPGVDYLSFGLFDLCQSLGHPADPNHPEVQAAVAAAKREISAAGKRVREDFMTFAWINDVLVAGAKQLLA